MPVDVACAACGANYSFPESMAGSETQCECGARFQIPGGLPIECPRCGATYRLPEKLAGTDQRCECGTWFGIPEPVVSEPEAEVSAAARPVTVPKPQKSWWDREVANWSLLTVVLLGCFCSVPAFVLGLLCYWCADTSEGRQRGVTLMIIGGIVTCLAFLLNAVGER